jgi:minimal PKS acyl carrier protein
MSTPQFSVADLVEILVRAAGLPAGTVPASDALTLADTGLDSLAFLQLQAELADRYAVELPDERRHEYTFGDIVAFVNGNLQPEPAA